MQPAPQPDSKSAWSLAFVATLIAGLGLALTGCGGVHLFDEQGAARATAGTDGGGAPLNEDQDQDQQDQDQDQASCEADPVVVPAPGPYVTSPSCSGPGADAGVKTEADSGATCAQTCPRPCPFRPVRQLITIPAATLLAAGALAGVGDWPIWPWNWADGAEEWQDLLNQETALLKAFNVRFGTNYTSFQSMSQQHKDWLNSQPGVDLDLLPSAVVEDAVQETILVSYVAETGCWIATGATSLIPVGGGSASIHQIAGRFALQKGFKWHGVPRYIIATAIKHGQRVPNKMVRKDCPTYVTRMITVYKTSKCGTPKKRTLYVAYKKLKDGTYLLLHTHYN